MQTSIISKSCIFDSVAYKIEFKLENMALYDYHHKILKYPFKPQNFYKDPEAFKGLKFEPLRWSIFTSIIFKLWHFCRGYLIKLYYFDSVNIM